MTATRLVPAARAAARAETAQELGLLDGPRDPAFERITRIARTLTQAPLAAFTVLDERWLRPDSNTDAHRYDARLCQLVIDQDAPLIVADARADTRFEPFDDVRAGRVRAYAGLPVRAPNGVTIGALCVMDPQQRTFDDAQVDALADLTRLLEEMLVLRALSLIDPLTGLHNRRHLDQVLASEWRRAYRHLLPLSLLVVDIDHFKLYNDGYGHPAGDDCLKRVAALLRSRAQRAGDLIARYGGEEFMLVLPETPLAGAKEIARRVLHAVADERIEHRGSPQGFLTLSVGGAVAAEDADLQRGERSLIAAADAALYEAKHAGRNTMRVHLLSAADAGAEAIGQLASGTSAT